MILEVISKTCGRLYRRNVAKKMKVACFVLVIVLIRLLLKRKGFGSQQFRAVLLSYFRCGEPEKPATKAQSLYKSLEVMNLVQIGLLHCTLLDLAFEMEIGSYSILKTCPSGTALFSALTYETTAKSNEEKFIGGLVDITVKYFSIEKLTKKKSIARKKRKKKKKKISVKQPTVPASSNMYAILMTETDS
eukprot:TRINITY_DN5338_c0_g1_i1.p1 TRINITY_DN5338_c0_g1~~TRINITY_DN5338_c0_g1_i1.p1  ORF type:complete len:190 (+),score=18.93 TRINITY_DN5338_c0_g1_i1:216-785(+)